MRPNDFNPLQLLMCEGPGLTGRHERSNEAVP
jgi:hypothetical protein